MGFSTLRILSSIVISTLLLPRFTLLYNSGQYQASSGQSSCTACPSGFYCATTGLTAYAACSAGTYSGSGAASCSACAAGKYSGNTASMSCASCEAGKYGASSGASSCVACSSGQWALSTGHTICDSTSSPTSVPTNTPTSQPTRKPVPKPTVAPTATPSPSFPPTQVRNGDWDLFACHRNIRERRVTYASRTLLLISCVPLCLLVIISGSVASSNTQPYVFSYAVTVRAPYPTSLSNSIV